MTSSYRPLRCTGICPLIVSHKTTASGRVTLKVRPMRRASWALPLSLITDGGSGCERMGQGTPHWDTWAALSSRQCYNMVSGSPQRPQRGLHDALGPLGRAFLMPRPTGVVDYFKLWGNRVSGSGLPSANHRQVGAKAGVRCPFAPVFPTGIWQSDKRILYRVHASHTREQCKKDARRVAHSALLNRPPCARKPGLARLS